MKLVKTKFKDFQSLKRQEIDMEGNFVESDKATENSDFSKGVSDFFLEIEGPYHMDHTQRSVVLGSVTPGPGFGTG